MNQTILRFLLDGSHVLDAVMPEVEAKQIVEGFRLGKLQPAVGGYDSVQKRSWSVLIERVSAVLTTPLTVPQGSAGLPAGIVPPYGGSGLN